MTQPLPLTMHVHRKQEREMNSQLLHMKREYATVLSRSTHQRMPTEVDHQGYEGGHSHLFRDTLHGTALCLVHLCVLTHVRVCVSVCACTFVCTLCVCLLVCV
jgi:hypothetical protein